MKLSQYEQDYLAGKYPEIITQNPTPPGGLASIWARAKSAVSSVLPWSQAESQAPQGATLGLFGDVYDPVVSTVKSSASAARLKTQAVQDGSGQTEGGCSWWNVVCRSKAAVSGAAESVGSFVSSTLTKALILIVVVAIVGLFLMSYTQAKASQLAAAK